MGFFTYLSVGTLINNFTIYDINNLEQNYDITKIENDYMKFSQHVYFRPLVGFVIAFLSKLNNYDPVNLVFSFKIFATFLNLLSFRYFLSNLKKLTQIQIYLLSYGYVFSHFYFYNFEIDAFSLLLSFPFLIILLEELNYFNKNLTIKNNIYFFKITILSSALFIVYPNSASVILLLIFIYFIFILLKNKKFNKNNFLYLFKFFLLFLIFIAPTYESTILYLIKHEIPAGLKSTVDFWGYYGAFAFGKLNPIYDLEVVKNIKNLFISNTNLKDLVHNVIVINLKAGNNYFYLNVIPSIFGFFHFTLGSPDSFINYFLIVFLILINIFIIKKTIDIIKIFFLSKKDLKYFYFIFIILFIFFSAYLFFENQYWSLIKLFFFFSPIFYIFVVLNFSLNSVKVNLVIILFLIFLPIYKYSKFNYGIGILDSYPSTIKENFKKNVNWQIDDALLKECSVISFEDQDHFKKIYISLKFNYLKKNIEKKHNLCEIKFINKNFVIKK